MPKIEERLTICEAGWPGEMRQKGARRMHRAPEIDIEQPLHLRLVDLVKLTEQRDAGIVDDDVQRRVRGDRLARKGGDRLAIADVEAVKADFSRGARSCGTGGDFGCGRLQAGLVAIGECEIGPARGKLDRQRPADAAGSTRDGHGSSWNRGHLIVL